MAGAFFTEAENYFYDSPTGGASSQTYTTYFYTGPMVAAEGDKSANVGYLTVFANPTIPNNIPDLAPACDVQGRWDWTTPEYDTHSPGSPDMGKWTLPQAVYTQSRGTRSVSRKRLLLRGSGPALQLYFTDGGSDLRTAWEILGWTIQESADAVA